MKFKLGRVLGVALAVAAFGMGNANTANVVIQEVYYDQPGADGTEVFTELFGSPGMSLDGFSLVGINGSVGEDYGTIDLSGFTIQADGISLIADINTNLTGADLLAASIDWQNGVDAVQLRFFDGNSVIVADAL